MKKVLTIAGSDCSGGAGVQADLKTMMAHQVYGMSVITAVTAQNTTGVFAVEPLSGVMVGKQLDAIFTDLEPDAVKIGMIASKEIAEVVVSKLLQYEAKNIVIDPVMISTSGHRLLSQEACQVLVDHLFSLATVITPNLPEMEFLEGVAIKTSEDMEKCGKIFYKRHKTSVLIKGGHFSEGANDLLVENGNLKWFTHERIDNPNTHGTGCTLSSAIACQLALGKSLSESVYLAKVYLSRLIQDKMDIGKGRGPLNHWS